MANLVGAGALAAGQARFDYVLPRVVSYLIQDVVTKSLNENLSLEMSVTEFLITRTYPIAGASARLLDAFLESAFVTSDPDAPINLTLAPFQSPANAYRRLQKAATLVTKWEMKPEEATWLFASGTTWLDPLALPVAPTATALPYFEKWDHTVPLIGLRDSLANGATVLRRLYQAANNAATTQVAYLSQLSQSLSWNLPDLQLLVGPQGLNLSFPADFQDEWALIQCRSALEG